MDYFDDVIFSELPNILNDAEFTNCEFKNINFQEKVITRSLFLESKFTNCNLTNSRFPGCTFRDVKFKGIRASGVNWTEASNLVTLSFDDCQLNYCSFLGLKLDKLVCINSQVKSSDFSETSLKEANFSKTDLDQSSFHNANCEKAIFNDSQNYSINPSYTKLKGASFSFPEALALLSSFEIRIDNL